MTFDFETTWLDCKKDDAIQIWIVQFNHKFEILNQFSSYIKPENFSDLSEIVEFTTNITKNSIENAPSFEEMKDKIKSFFDENTVLIWHNVNFDIGFLEKYIWKIPHFAVFDTYKYSRLLLHFEQSYALEILADKYDFKKNSHDALEDAIMSKDLFALLVRKIYKIIKKYPFLQDIILKSDTIFDKILDISKTNNKIQWIPKSQVNIPKVKKIKNNTKLINEYENKSVFNIKNLALEDVLNFWINSQNKVIIAFASKSRVWIAKSILKQKYLAYSSIYTWNIVDLENEKKLLTKEVFEEYEAHYIIKMFSHYLEDMSVFDISNLQEYKVHSFVSWKKRNLSWNIILCTHQELFKFIKERWNDDIKNHLVLFFDWHMRANSLSWVVNQAFDFYELLNKLEILQYEKEFEENTRSIEKIINEISAFFGSFFTELQNLFKGTNNKIEIVNIFSETKRDFAKFKEWFVKLSLDIDSLWEKEISNYWNIFKECVENYCILEQKLFFGDNLKYIFNPLMENVDINTYNDYMQDLKYYNFTVLENPNYIKLEKEINSSKLKNNIIDYHEKIDFKKLVIDIKGKIQENKSIFLVSNNKNFSNNLFKLIFNLCKEYNLNTNIYAENITWWTWKLLYFLKKDKNPKITIWWPEFLFANKANFIKYNEILLLSMWWKSRENMIEDINFYL